MIGTSQSSDDKNLLLIQLLRGIASLLVVFMHVTVNAKEISNQIFLGGFFKFGGAGVDIFFVLSGFIITYTSRKGIGHFNKLLPFLSRRFIRIFPTYWIIIGMFLLLQIILPAFYKTHYSFTAENFLSTWFLLPGHTMVNGVSWTLTNELFFYALFSLAFLIPGKRIAFSLSMLYAVALIVIPIFGYNAQHGNYWINLIMLPMNVEFFMGVLAATIIPYISKALSMPLVIGGSIIFLLNAILSNQGFYLLPDSFNRVLFFGIPSFLIVTGLVKYELSKNIRVHNILLSLGEASYSLYLLHLPLVVAGIKIIARFNIENNIILHGLLFLLIGIICFASILFYKWVEKSLINKLKGQYKSPVA